MFTGSGRQANDFRPANTVTCIGIDCVVGASLGNGLDHRDRSASSARSSRALIVHQELLHHSARKLNDLRVLAADVDHHAITLEQTRGTVVVACDFSHDFIGERHRHAPIPIATTACGTSKKRCSSRCSATPFAASTLEKPVGRIHVSTISPAPSSTATFVAVDPTSTPIPSISTLSCRGEDIRNALSCAFRFAHAAPGCPTPKHEAARHAAQ